MKKKAVISLDPEVYDRFKQLSYEQHLPMSALVTSWVMAANVTYEQRWNQKTMRANTEMSTGEDKKSGGKSYDSQL